MKAGKGILALPLSVYFVLLCSACSYFEGGDAAGPAPSSSNMTVEKAEANLRQAEEKRRLLKAAAESPKLTSAEIQTLQDKATQLKKAATAAQQKADRMGRQSSAAGHDPDNPKDSPNTYKATQQASAAKTQAAEAQKALDEAKTRGIVSADDLAKADQAVTQASKDLEDAKQRTQAEARLTPSTSSRGEADEARSILLTFLPPVITTLLLLAVIGLLHRSIVRRLEQMERVLIIQLRDVSAELATAQGNVGSTVTKSLKGSPELSALGKKLEDLEVTLNKVHDGQASKDPDNPAEVEVQILANDEEPNFPISAEDYLNRMQGKLRYLKHDYPNSMLIEDAENGEFALVSDNGARGGLFKIVPKLNRFPTKQDYYTVQYLYFDCNPPFSGAVTIIEPALVRATDGGWQLDQKGELRVA